MFRFEMPGMVIFLVPRWDSGGATTEFQRMEYGGISCYYIV